MDIRSELASPPPRELIEKLSIRIYEAPLSKARDRLFEISEPWPVLILVLDFDTEVSMQGMLSFLENSTGLHFPETIEAFETIGAHETVEILRAIEKTLHRHGITPSRLRDDFAGTEPYQITMFNTLHGDLSAMPEEVRQDAKRLYVDRKDGEPVWSLLEAFVARHRQELLTEFVAQ